MRYRTKPVEIEAVQFNKFGDHPAVNLVPKGDGWDEYFELDMGHGIIVVEPGEFIVTDEWGERRTFDPESFLNKFEPIPEPRSGLYQCSGCGQIFEWELWKSEMLPNVYQCDRCTPELVKVESD